MYRRTYEWDDKNQLIKSQDDNVTVCYTYGSDGQRASKYTENSETLYTNNFWVFHVSGSVRNGAGIINKNIYLGKMRVVTKVKEAFDAMEITERQCQYFYHSDHLGSAQLVTDNNGNEYQRIEYTPYGETWIDLKATQNDLVKLNYKFTAKELDEETGLYYYGARYLDPKYSMWISTDPAMNTGEYFPVAPTSEDARSHNQNLPGLGGVFNTVNLNLYHYAANNPIKYTDPDGRETLSKRTTFQIKFDLSFSQLEDLAICWQDQYEKGDPIKQIFSAFGIIGDVSTGTQIALESIGKTLSTIGKAAFKTLDTAVFFVGLMELLVPDNVNAPRDAVHSFYFSLLKKKKDGNFEILKITSTVTTTEERSIVNHHDYLIATTTKTKVVLEAEVYDKYRDETIIIRKEYTLTSCEMEL